MKMKKILLLNLITCNATYSIQVLIKNNRSCVHLAGLVKQDKC